MEHLVAEYGLMLLFLLIFLESAGVPMPGETALIAASLLAARGQLRIGPVIVVASTAAIAGDSAGYWIGRWGGRRLLRRWPLLARYAARFLPRAERLFARHGGKTVFLARFITGLRVAGAWIAGAMRMDWWRFLCWNAAGGLVWAAGTGFLAYYLGRAATDILGRRGLIVGAVGIAAMLGGFHLLLRRRPWRSSMPEWSSHPSDSQADEAARAR